MPKFEPRKPALTDEQIKRIKAMAQHPGCRLSTRRTGKEHPQIVLTAPGHGEQIVGVFWPTELESAFDEAETVFHAAKPKAKEATAVNEFDRILLDVLARGLCLILLCLGFRAARAATRELGRKQQ